MNNKKRSRGFCFTLQVSDNFNVDNYTDLCGKLSNDSITFSCFQVEKAPSTGKLHVQGYVYVSNPRLPSAISKFIGGNPHIEIAKGSPSQNAEYCSKLESREPSFEPFVYGVLPKQGSTNSLVLAKREIDSGKSPSVLIQDEALFSTFIRYGRSLREYASSLQLPRDFKPMVVVLWGPTGTGKSRLARQRLRDSVFSTVHLQEKSEWWDEYTAGTDVIIDDFCDVQLSSHRFKNVFDRYAMKLPIKGGFVEFNAKRIYITSNQDPATWYFGDAACQRRITEIVYMPVFDPNLFE